MYILSNKFRKQVQHLSALIREKSASLDICYFCDVVRHWLKPKESINSKRGRLERYDFDD